MLSDTRPDYVPHSRNHIQESKGERMNSKFTTEPIPDRGISLETAKKYGVKVRKDTNDNIVSHAYPYYDYNGQKVLAYKKRDVENKTFSIMTSDNGSFTDSSLFGQQLFSGKGKYITLVEGELSRERYQEKSGVL
jgi:hypothetical protein